MIRLVVLLALLSGCLFQGAAQAGATTFEPTGHFGGVVLPPAPAVFPEDAQLGGTGAMAINLDGAGGVAAGTLYAVSRGLSGGPLRVARYEPGGSGMTFVEAWEVRRVEGPYERCGPLLGTQCPTRPEAPPRWVDVEIDQVTGNIYVFSTENLLAGDTTITVFSPDGSEVITRFGVLAPGGVATAATPENVHDSTGSGGIAVDGNGTVYVFDLNVFDNFNHRLMTFKPAIPGDPKTYAYVGGADIAAGFQGEGNFPAMPITDESGDIYVAGETYIEKYAPGQPKPAICKFELKGGGITAMTVNSATGEVFYYTYKNKQIHMLSACVEGKFTEVPPAIAVAPERAEIFALTFDPVRQLELGREPGVLYAAAPGPVPNSGGKGEPGMGALGYIFAPVAEVPPLVESEAVSGVGPSSAELEAEINPKGSQTSFRFEYITDAAYQEAGESFGPGTLEAPEGGGVLGAGQNPLHAAVAVGSLAPDTRYRFRVRAESNCSSEPLKLCEDIGATESFHTYPVQVGPQDRRAWELVSPPLKSGGQVLPAEPILNSCGLIECKPGAGLNHFPMRSAPEGQAVVFEGTPFGDEGAVIENQYIARRGAGGWVTTNLTPPLLQSKGGQGYKAFDQGLRAGILEQTAPSLSPFAPAEYTNLYRQPTATPLTLEPLISSTPPNRVSGNGAGSFKTVYVGSSADFLRHVFEANDALTAPTASAPEAMDPPDPAKENNLYESVGGELRLVNVLPGNAVSIPGAVLGSGTLLKSGEANSPATVVTNAISDDGSRIFWTSKAGQLYVRVNGTETVEIEDAGKFITASADGSRVLLSDGCLYDLAAADCEDLTAGSGGFLGIAGQSEDLSHIYFVDTAVLSGEENDQGEQAVAGKPNLYAWVEGSIGYIATLLASDNKITDNTGDWQASPSYRSAEASPNGRWLAYVSTAQLTGGDNIGPCGPVGESGQRTDAPCSQVFLFDSTTAELICPSCNSTGAAPLGRSVLRLIKSVPGSLAQPAYLSDSGRLYFDSADSLSYLDSNGAVEDVYQYEPAGVGTCVREAGCVSLISSGRGAVDSNFLASDAVGDNVFFTSRDRLVPADKDDLLDLYDARVDGEPTSHPPPIPCQGEACQSPPPPPTEATSASQSMLGPGNHKPPKCKKGKVRRNGRCVTKQKHKGKRSQGKSKSSERGGSK